MQTTSKILILGIGLLICSCNTTSLKEKRGNDGNGMGISYVIKNKVFDRVLDSLADEMNSLKKYKPVMGYVQILNSTANEEFKIVMGTIEHDSIFKKLQIDGYLLKKGILFCINSSTSELIENTSKVNIEALKQKANYKYSGKYRDIGHITWLVSIKGDKVEKINKHAQSPFGPKCLNCLEWGGFIGDDGKIHDLDYD